MLKVKMIPILARIVAKIDLDPIVARFKALDVVKEGQSGFSDLTDEQKATIAFELLGAITPQLDKIAEELPALIAEFKGVTQEEAGELDFLPVIGEILSDTGITSFFGSALQKKVAPGR